MTLAISPPSALFAQHRDVRLVDAVRIGDHHALRLLLRQKADVNSAAPDGSTPLHWAAQLDDLETAELLLRAGARADTPNDYGITPLFLASQNGSAAMVAALLAAGGNPNATTPAGETALMTASRTGKPAAVLALLKHGADVNAEEPTLGQTALMWAAAEGHSEVVRLLLEHGSDVRATSNPGTFRHPSIVHTGSFTPLLFAVRRGDMASIRVLVSAGADVNGTATDGTSPLLMATIRGDLACAELLLDHGADVNIAAAGFTPLHRVVGEWNSQVTLRIGTATADSSEWGILGGLRGQAKRDFVTMLLRRGADPDVRVRMEPPRLGGGGGPRYGDSPTVLLGATPLLLAAMAGDAPAVRILLAAGADPHATTDDQTTALILASGFGFNPDSARVPEGEALEVVKMLADLGADVNEPNRFDTTALHAAASRGANAIIRFLVNRGADLEARDKRGWSAMTYAEGIFQGATLVPYPGTEAVLKEMGAKPTPPGIVRDRRRDRDVVPGIAIPGLRGQPATPATPKAP
jgi:uncharacterized protein